MAYYVYYLNTDEDTHDIDKVSGLKWVLGVIITMVASDDESGAIYVNTFWDRLFKLTVQKKEGDWEKNYSGEDEVTRNKIFWFFPFKLSREWTTRQIMDWFMNSVCRTILLGTAPIVLC